MLEARPNGLIPYTIPNTTLFAARRISPCDLLGREVKNLHGCGHVDVLSLFKDLKQTWVLRQMRQNTRLDLAIVGAEQMMSVGAMKASRMRRPSSPLTGMFWRLGSVDERRPVAATV